MILRKPYAFLIKFFKVFHIIMFVIFVYLIFILRKIYLFLSNYAKTNNFSYFEDMVSRYVPILPIILILIVIILGIFIYSLIRKKEKPILFYKILLIYSVLLFIVLIYSRGFFSSLDMPNYERLWIVIYRDIVGFLYYINYFYVGFCFIRGFGFDIKKFSFDKDRRELKLDASDNEEYEVNIGIDKENIITKVNREKREFSYYLKENKAFLILIGIILLIGFGSYFYLNNFVYNKISQEKEDVLINNITYKVNSSFHTAVNKYGDVISQNNSFVIVNLNILNNNNARISFNKEKFRLHLGDNYYYPVYNYQSDFDDLGNLYNVNTEISSKGDYILIFKIGSYNYEKAYLEILKNNDYQYSEIILSIQDLRREIINVKMEEEIPIENNTFNILKYTYVNQTTYQYRECLNDLCKDFTKSIVPGLNNSVLMLEIANLNNYSSVFYENSLGINYLLNNIEYNVSAKDIKVLGTNNNILYLSVPKKVVESTEVKLTINLRDKIYMIGLE